MLTANLFVQFYMGHKNLCFDFFDLIITLFSVYKRKIKSNSFLKITMLLIQNFIFDSKNHKHLIDHVNSFHINMQLAPLIRSSYKFMERDQSRWASADGRWAVGLLGRLVADVCLFISKEIRWEREKNKPKCWRLRACSLRQKTAELN